MKDPIAEVLNDMMPDPDGAPRMVTGWVVVATFADADGFQQLAYATSEGMPSWVARGLLVEPLLTRT